MNTTSNSSPSVYAPYLPDGTQYYADNADTNNIVPQQISPLVMKALDMVSNKKRPIFRICDYGTSDGSVSLPLMSNIIEFIKKKWGVETQIQIVYEDQPMNNFKSLLLRVHGLVPGSSTYLTHSTGVYVAVVGIGYYDQCVPDNSIHLGISTSSMHWMSKCPCNLTGTMNHKLATVKEEQRIWREQGAKDWETILLKRAKELEPGGQMVICCDCVIDEWPNRNESTIYQNLDNILQSLVEDGHVTTEESLNTNICIYERTKEEFEAPWNDPDSPVPKSGLTLISIDFEVSTCQNQQQWLKRKNEIGSENSAKLHAVQFTASTRKWLNSSIFDGLSKTRSIEERNHIVEEFFRRLQDGAEKAPDDYFMHYHYAKVHISKNNDSFQ